MSLREGFKVVVLVVEVGRGRIVFWWREVNMAGNQEHAGGLMRWMRCAWSLPERVPVQGSPRDGEEKEEW